MRISFISKYFSLCLGIWHEDPCIRALIISEFRLSIWNFSLDLLVERQVGIKYIYPNLYWRVSTSCYGVTHILRSGLDGREIQAIHYVHRKNKAVIELPLTNRTNLGT